MTPTQLPLSLSLGHKETPLKLCSPKVQRLLDESPNILEQMII